MVVGWETLVQRSRIEPLADLREVVRGLWHSAPAVFLSLIKSAARPGVHQVAIKRHLLCREQRQRGVSTLPEWNGPQVGTIRIAAPAPPMSLLPA